MGRVRRADLAERAAIKRRDTVAAELVDERLLLELAQASIAGIAKQTYQDGALGAFGSVLSAQDAADFASRAASLDTVWKTSGHAVELVNALPDRIDSLQDRLDTANAARRTTGALADRMADSHAELAESIESARAQAAPLRQEADAALKAAREAIPLDQALALLRSQESSRLAGEIVAAQHALADAGDTVEGTGSFVMPATGAVTSPYGWREHPILGYIKMHTGLDIDGADGVVYAADRGTVIMTVYNTAYGNLTVIDHGLSGGRYLATFYAHQAAFFVQPGDVVAKDQPIGEVGSTGMSTGPHLHFEVRIDGVPVDPGAFLDD
jgi:murein DD-endopeptidase MepM/ murein hydrolase activator NlpD